MMHYIFQFNSNIRCIEMYYANGGNLLTLMFNSNIRCIEIRHIQNKDTKERGLIVTLDVLKSKKQLKEVIYYCKFNSNIRCIEIAVCINH